jgi:hypothetical protein
VRLNAEAEAEVDLRRDVGERPRRRRVMFSGADRLHDAAASPRTPAGGGGARPSRLRSARGAAAAGTTADAVADALGSCSPQVQAAEETAWDMTERMGVEVVELMLGGAAAAVVLIGMLFFLHIS